MKRFAQQVRRLYGWQLVCGSINLICTFIATILLGEAVVYAQSSAETRALQWLAGTNVQNLDGSWGSSDELKPLFTVNAVLAFDSMRQRNVAYYKGITWLENHAFPNVDYKARRILALAPRGNNVQEDYDYLMLAQDLAVLGNGGWGLTPNYVSSALDTALVLQACSAAACSSGTILPALQYLRDTQTSGAWSVGLGVGSDPITTAHVLQALIPYRALYPTYVTSAEIAGAVAAIVALVPSTQTSLLKAHAAVALLQENSASAHGQLLLNSLRSEQLSNGSWTGDAYITAMAVRALAVGNGLASAAFSALADPVFVPDAKLREAINMALGKNKGDALTKGDLSRLTSLNALGMGIKNIRGLEYAINLQSADLRSNFISDISNLRNLNSLADVKLAGNPLSSTVDSDGDGAFDEEEGFAGTHPFNSASHPIFHVQGDVAGLQALKNALGAVGQLTDAWHVIWEDLDGDTDLDVVIYVHGADEQWDVLSCSYDCGGPSTYWGSSRGQLWLFENDNGAFALRAWNPGEDRPNGDVSDLLVFDYNNDGKKDLLLVLHPVYTNISSQDTNAQHRDLVLMKNIKNAPSSPLGFADVTQTVGLPGPTYWGANTWGAVVVDLNRDGYPDIFTEANPGRFWQFNPSSQTFQDVMPSTGLPNNLSQAIAVDLDNDGDLDIVSASGGNEGVLRIFKNSGTGTFTQIANPSVTSLTPLVTNGWITKLIPADYNHDGLLDLVVFRTVTTPADYAGSSLRLVQNRSTTQQLDLALDTIVTGFEQSNSSNDFSYGGAVGDIDNDGDFDVLISSLIATDWTTLYRNNGDLSYTKLGATTNIRRNGNEAPMFGDLNGDGRLDVWLPPGHSPGLPFKDYLYTNLESGSHYLTINLIGKILTTIPSSSKDALGARVKVALPGGATQWQQVLAGYGMPHALHFGLGAATSATVTVYWPSGAQTTKTYAVGNPLPDTIDQYVTISEP